ncbi:carboxy terminal-processing peptidase [Syntrophotalea acetylenica]|uniref:PDZ domain-containing protein n=1 Tax=Syntrophotalea acetylenica TaxID=29542 RepID=A0A1L3GIV6_SYNAC|nr:carboxy terminal-processing peptidase [Syntrophotalea acetylenica]APG25815.1 hypothetical protein A7E75_12940 [Syntrophotalea acetylenica]APG43886.1 hypothetical protein A6070_06955 [Syntrophotalea acetylenica]MDY0262320.1 carboxy terminal-processing peptidase [Syntrophotalea acetylenica]
MKYKKSWFCLLAAVLLFAVTMSWSGLASQQISPDAGHLRGKLLTHLIRQQMTVNHFSHKPLDDKISQAAFDLYIQQLDFQKRFLLESDIQQLSLYRNRIDDDIVRGNLELHKTGARLLRIRVNFVMNMIDDLLNKKFDFNKKDQIETDPEKIDYAKNSVDLKRRWEKILKYQVLMRYVQLLEERTGSGKNTAANEGKVDKILLNEAVQKVRRSTHHLLGRLLEETEQDHFERFLNAYVRAYDPHSAYLAPDALEDFEIYMKGSLEGIGATLREDDGFIRVVEIIPGSPAARQGQLAAEDIILKVGEGDREPVDVTETRLRDAVRLIRGKKGTVVRLTVRKPTGREQIIRLVRDVVEIEEGFAKSTTLPVPGKTGKHYGYLRIPSFYRDFSETRDGQSARNVTDDVRRELQLLVKKGIDGLVLDLRDNGGGSLSDAIDIAGLFIPKGPVVQVKDSEGEVRVYEDEDPGIVYGGPLVVLVNRFSASASEILAGAIQDYGRGVIVGGGGTHGKGTVQAIFDMDQPLAYGPLQKLAPLGALKVTVQKFYRISGGSTQVKGVVPDIQLPDRLAFLETGEKFIEYALPWDTTRRVSFKRWAQAPEVATLRHLSAQRVEKGHRFDAVVAETRRNAQRSRATLRSLNLNSVLRERTALQERGLEAETADHEVEAPLEHFSGKHLEEKVAQDLYVQESIAVLGDLHNQLAGHDCTLAGALSSR